MSPYSYKYPIVRLIYLQIYQVSEVSRRGNTIGADIRDPVLHRYHGIGQQRHLSKMLERYGGRKKILLTRGQTFSAAFRIGQNCSKQA